MTNQQYKRTISGLSSVIYSRQKAGSARRRYELPSYTRIELMNWLISHSEFELLYSNWIKSSYAKNLRPSVDRIDDYKSYTFDNIQLTTYEQNINRSYSDRKNGINNKISKKVDQYDLNNNFIQTFHSIREAERQTKIPNQSILLVCQKKRNKAGKFIWKYGE